MSDTAADLARYIQDAITSQFQVPFEEKLVSNAIQKFKTDRDLTLTGGEPTQFVVQNIVNPVLYLLELDIDIEIKQLVTHVLDAVFTFYSLEQILVITSLEWLLSGLQSNVLDLQLMCVSLVARASPADIVANTPIMKMLVLHLAKKNTPLELVNAIEIAIQDLLPGGELIQRRFKSDEVVSVLTQMSADDITRGRLCDVLVTLVPYLNHGDLPDSLFVYSIFELQENDDPLALVLILNFYSKLLDTGKSWIVDMLWRELEAVVLSYTSGYIHENPVFLENDTSVLIAKLSYIPQFAKLDEKFKILKLATEDPNRYGILLAQVNPHALLASQPEFICQFSLKALTVPIYCNIVSSVEVFSECPITGRDILRLPAPLNYECIRVVVEYPHGRSTLLTKWSAVMSFLLDETTITETSIWQLKMDILQHLIVYSTEQEKGIWNPRLVRLYSHMKGTTQVQTTVADSAA